MKAVLLCGGEGTRMRPLTLETPKPLLKIDDKTILEYIFENLKGNEIYEVVLTIGYLKNKIKTYFEDGSKIGMKIEYLEEDEKKNTAGSILPLKGKMNEDFVVMMGDQITGVNLKKMIETHKKHNAIATIAIKKKEYKLEYGTVEITDEEVKGFKEKPIIEKYINTAIYILSPRIFEFIKEKEDFAKNVFPRLLKEKQKVVAYKMEEEWIDIGRLSDYEKLVKSPERIKSIKRKLQ